MLPRSAINFFEAIDWELATEVLHFLSEKSVVDLLCNSPVFALNSLVPRGSSLRYLHVYSILFPLNVVTKFK